MIFLIIRGNLDAISISKCGFDEDEKNFPLSFLSKIFQKK